MPGRGQGRDAKRGKKARKERNGGVVLQSNIKPAAPHRFGPSRREVLPSIDSHQLSHDMILPMLFRQQDAINCDDAEERKGRVRMLLMRKLATLFAAAHVANHPGTWRLDRNYHSRLDHLLLCALKSMRWQSNQLHHRSISPFLF